MSRRSGHRTWWHAVCECGQAGEVRSDSLVGGGSTQCARCSASERSRSHGLSKADTWKSWRAMRNRCLNPAAADFPKYGGRGISVCARWDDFPAFLSDMGERPSQMTLDRIDPNGDYSPDNCRWATPKEQNRNRRKTVFLTVNGERKSLSAWAEQNGVRHITYFKRYEAGWPDEKIVTTPVLPPTCPKPRHQHRRRCTST